MQLIKLIDEYDRKVNYEYEENGYYCLLFALQLPGICARYIFSQNEENTCGNNILNDVALYKKNGSPIDKNLYRKWFVKYKKNL